MRIIFIILFLFSQITSAEVKAADVKGSKSLEQRVLELEQQQKIMDEWYSNFVVLGKGRMRPFLGESISFGGYFEAAVTNLHGKDMEDQTAANIQVIGINITAEFTEKIKFVTQLLSGLSVPLKNPNNNPNLTPNQRQFSGFIYGSLVAQGFIEYNSTDLFNIQSGVGYAPYGQGFREREPFLFFQRGGPQMINTSDLEFVGLANPLWSGIHMFGVFPTEKRFGYNLYSFTPFVEVSSLGIGGRLWADISENVTTGISAQAGPQKNAHFFSRGADIVYKSERFQVTAEYAYSGNSSQALDVESYYIQPAIKFFGGEWLVYVNADYLNFLNHKDALTATADPIKKWQYGAGVNWLPLPNARFRLGFIHHDYIDEANEIDGQKRDFNTLDFSTAIAF